MATITYRVTTYRFKAPAPLSEQEFNHCKQAYASDPSFSLEPKGGFWDEFRIYIYVLAAYVIAVFISAITGDLDIVPWFGLGVVALWLVTGQAKTMYNYSRYLKKRAGYYSKFKEIVLKSEDYASFQKNELNWVRSCTIHSL